VRPKTVAPDAASDPQILESRWVRTFLADLIWELPGPQVRATLTGIQAKTAGNSVGSNMAAVMALMARDRGGPKISFHTWEN
jgi:hypothetical protein